MSTKSIKQRWSTVLRSGNNALGVVLDAIAHVQEHGDTSLIAGMIASAEAGDMPSYAKRLRRLTSLVFTEAKIRKNKDGGYSITRGDAYDQAFVVTLTTAHAEGYSLIGPKLGEMIGETKEQLTPEAEMTKRVKSAAKWIASTDNVSVEAFITELRKEYAAQTALKAVA